MFPCEMARYIAGFSREARKSGPFLPPAEPRCQVCRSWGEEFESSSASQSGTKVGIEVRILRASGTGSQNEQSAAESARRGALVEFEMLPGKGELLQRGVDIPELGAQAASDTVDRADDSQRDTRRDQAIFN